MKTTNDVTHYASKEAYQAKKSQTLKGLAKTLNPQSISKDLNQDKMLEKLKKVSEKRNIKNIKDKLKVDKNEVKKAAKHLLKDGVGVLKSAIKAVGTKQIPLKVLDTLMTMPDSFAVQTTETKVDEKTKDIKQNESSIFFITGLDLSLFDDEENGLRSLAKFTAGSTHETWANEDKVLDSIKKLPLDKPIMLIGHSLGSDAAVSIANKLNSAEYGFRDVDLLVTLDSVGFDNDIIPNNVKLNQNYISDQDYFFNDGPNIARDHLKSTVNNYLLDRLHTQIDSDKEVQSSISRDIRSLRDQETST